MTSPRPLKMDCFYHIYNRGINGETIFRNKQDYSFFLLRYKKYIEPIAYTFAFCFYLPSHIQHYQHWTGIRRFSEGNDL